MNKTTPGECLSFERIHSSGVNSICRDEGLFWGYKAYEMEIADLKEENEELKEFYDTLLSTEGLLPMNTVAKELGIGLKRLYLFLRTHDVMFYKGNVNIPYQRFMEQGLFKVKETPCKDGVYRPATYATRKGLEYIRKILRKDGYYNAEVTV